MKKAIKNSLLALSIIITILFNSITAFANHVPSLQEISFNNATINEVFNPNSLEHTITLEDNTKSPTLKDYSLNGNASIYLTYSYDNNRPIGITVKVENEFGSRNYHFNYSNPVKYTPSSNCLLSSIYTVYGEISPEFDKNTFEYKLYIPMDLTQLEITPVTEDINAKCPKVNITLSPNQAPKITLTCTSSNGATRDYLLDVQRVDKTIAAINTEMKNPEYTSFVEGTRLYERPEFLVACITAALSVALFFVLLKITKRITISPYDKDEKPFYIND